MHYINDLLIVSQADAMRAKNVIRGDPVVDVRKITWQPPTAILAESLSSSFNKTGQLALAASATRSSFIAASPSII